MAGEIKPAAIGTQKRAAISTGSPWRGGEEVIRLLFNETNCALAYVYILPMDKLPDVRIPLGEPVCTLKVMLGMPDLQHSIRDRQIVDAVNGR